MKWPPSLEWFKKVSSQDPPLGKNDAMVLLHVGEAPKHISAMPCCVHVSNGKTLAWVSEMPFDVISQGGIQGGGTIKSNPVPKPGKPDENYEVATAVVSRSSETAETHHYHLRFFKTAADRPNNAFAEDLSSPIIIID